MRREAPNGGRSGGPRARRGARGDFSNPRTDEGDLAENPRHKIRILYIFFFQFVGSNPKITNPILFNFKRYNKQIVSIIASQLAYNSFFLFGRNVFYKTRLFVS